MFYVIGLHDPALLGLRTKLSARATLDDTTIAKPKVHDTGIDYANASILQAKRFRLKVHVWGLISEMALSGLVIFCICAGNYFGRIDHRINEQ